MSNGLWQPTAGADRVLDGRLNVGTWNGQPIYIHFTSQQGYDAITANKLMLAAPHARRGRAAKYGIYLNPSTQTFDAVAAHTLLFFAEDRYRNSSTHCLVFAFRRPVSVEEQPLSDGSWVRECIYRQSIAYAEIDLLYTGTNPFATLTRQRHEYGWAQAS